MAMPQDQHVDLAGSQQQTIRNAQDAFDPHAEQHAGHEDELSQTLHSLIAQASEDSSEAHHTILAPAHSVDNDDDTNDTGVPPSQEKSEQPTTRLGSLKKFITEGYQKLTTDAVYYRYGNYVTTRGPNPERTFEQMPLYTRIGMHLLFCGSIESKLLKDSKLQHLFLRESVEMGKHFDSPESANKISGFVKSFNLDLNDLEVSDISAYRTFNDFFARRLKKDARPASDPQDPNVLVSAADCRVVVFPSVSQSTRFWVKGKHFTIPTLLDLPHHQPPSPPSTTATTATTTTTTTDSDSEKEKEKEARRYENMAIAIFRLAPQDYHHWHSPVSGTVISIHDVSGTLMTVNPMAINEDLDVFTMNKRSIMRIRPDFTPRSSNTRKVGRASLSTGNIGRDAEEKNGEEETEEEGEEEVIIVAIGAMLVGSILWSPHLRPGTRLQKGENLGEFRYGGSTVLFLSTRRVSFDEDLVRNSAEVSDGRSCETVVRVGERIGVVAE